MTQPKVLCKKYDALPRVYHFHDTFTVFKLDSDGLNQRQSIRHQPTLHKIKFSYLHFLALHLEILG